MKNGILVLFFLLASFAAYGQRGMGPCCGPNNLHPINPEEACVTDGACFEVKKDLKCAEDLCEGDKVKFKHLRSNGKFGGKTGRVKEIYPNHFNKKLHHGIIDLDNGGDTQTMLKYLDKVK
jgi:hypothetical protein